MFVYLGSKLYLAVFVLQAYRRDRLSGYRRIGTMGYRGRLVGVTAARLIGPYAYRHGACWICRVVTGSGRTVVRYQLLGSGSCSSCSRMRAI